MAGRAWARPAFGRQTPKGLVSIRSFLLLPPPPPPSSCCPALLCFIPSHRHCLSVRLLQTSLCILVPLPSLSLPGFSHFPQSVLLLALPFFSSLFFGVKFGQFISPGPFAYFHDDKTNTSKYKTPFVHFFHWLKM